MTTGELITLLQQHEGKRVGVAFMVERDGNPAIAIGPFQVSEAEGDIALVPSVFMKEEPTKAGVSNDLLETLVPEIHLKQTKKIAESVDDLVRYMQEHGLMADINIKSGQKNDERYFAYAIQAYHMGVLK